MNLAKRVATAAVGIPLLIFAVFNRTPLPYTGGYLFFLFPLFVTLLGASELNTLLEAGSAVKPRRLLYLLFAAVTVAGSFGPLDGGGLPHRTNWTGAVAPAEWLALALLLALFLIVVGRLARAAIPGTVGDAGQALLVIAGLALPASFLTFLWRLPNGSWSVLLVLLATMAADTGGYFAGRALGRTKLSPAISPKKTVVGFWGGLVAASLVTLGIGIYAGFGVGHSLLLGVILSVGGQLGDLAESLVKREMQVKDSGTLLPGHGGILDRFDALLFNAPLGYLYFITVAVR